MKYRVSFYRKAELVDGRAPRHMVDFESDTVEQARAHFEAEPGVVVRSVYKGVKSPILEKTGFMFESAEARNRWYNNHSAVSIKMRHCHFCKKNKVERYKRMCVECRDKRQSKTCKICGVEISNRVYCSSCLSVRKQQKEKAHRINRIKRVKKHTITRIESQISWAHDVLKTTTQEKCRLASRYQGLRIPHKLEGNRCRHCLQKFIEVQTEVLKSLKGEKNVSAYAN